MLADTDDMLAAAATTDPDTGLPDVRALIQDLDLPGSLPRRLDAMALHGLGSLEDPFALSDDRSLGERVGAALTAVAGHHDGRAYVITGGVYVIVTSEAFSMDRLIGSAAQVALDEVSPRLGARLLHTTVTTPSPRPAGRDLVRLALSRLRLRSCWGPLSPARQARDVLLQLLAERRLSGATAARDSVALHAVAVGRELRMPPDELDQLVRAAELQDVGMLGLPDRLLLKRGRLDDHEWGMVRRHPVVGERIVGAAPALAVVARLVRSAYEHYDGSGYPDRLRGDVIPLGSRIICVCVAFDAMTSPRPYREARTESDALAELEECAGRQFDPEIVAIFRRVVGRLEFRTVEAPA